MRIIAPSLAKHQRFQMSRSAMDRKPTVAVRLGPEIPVECGYTERFQPQSDRKMSVLIRKIERL
jgi:hypothetical protein